MNATRVSKSAGLRLGMILTAMLLMVSCLPANGSEAVITVTGTLSGGRDDYGIFGMGRSMPKGTLYTSGLFGMGRSMPKGTPYTIVFTFDGTKAKGMPAGCPGSGSRIVGGGQASPGTAVLTINGKSYEFGHKPDARSKTWRSIATLCSDSEIGVAVEPLYGRRNRAAPLACTRARPSTRRWRWRCVGAWRVRFAQI